MEFEPKKIIGHDPHLFIGFHIIDVDGVHVVEGLVEGFCYLYLEINDGVENPDFLELY